LNDITLNRNDLKDYLQLILGYSLTGKTNLQQLYIWYGLEGANRKTILIEIMRKILGPYFVQAHKEVFVKVDGARAGSASPYLAELKGKRMAVFCETKIDDKLNETQIKALTRSDRIKARELYKSEIEFSNNAKVFICSNYKPNSHTNNKAW
jgi:putative DNA primase/helicase